MKKEFKIGDNVFDIRFGKGIVVEGNGSHRFPVNVRFSSNGNSITYTLDGYYNLDDVNPSLFHLEDNPLKNKERVIEVSSNKENWYKRVLVKFIGSEAICWCNVETIEQAKTESAVHNWKYWREIQEPDEQILELTFQEISEGKGVGHPAHLIRIKV